MSDTTEKYQPTLHEAMHYIVLWMFNYTKKDFELAFKNSPLGWEYNWYKLREKFEAGTDKSTAIKEVVLNLDRHHLGMLCDYLLKTKYKDLIVGERAHHKQLATAEFECTVFEAIQNEYKFFHVFGPTEKFDVAANSELEVRQAYPDLFVTHLVRTNKEDWNNVVKVL